MHQIGAVMGMELFLIDGGQSVPVGNIFAAIVADFRDAADQIHGFTAAEYWAHKNFRVYGDINRAAAINW